MKNKDREAVLNKYDGRCAYCGQELVKGWHVDEVEPVRRSYDWDSGKRKWVFVGYIHPERMRIDNQVPACPSCNINKHSMSVEDFRQAITQFVESLNKYSTQYKIAKRYGLVNETGAEVIFHFEKISIQSQITHTI